MLRSLLSLKKQHTPMLRLHFVLYNISLYRDTPEAILSICLHTVLCLSAIVGCDKNGDTVLSGFCQMSILYWDEKFSISHSHLKDPCV